jgi:hypothetical protein
MYDLWMKMASWWVEWGRNMKFYVWWFENPFKVKSTCVNLYCSEVGEEERGKGKIDFVQRNPQLQGILVISSVGHENLSHALI